LRRSRVTSGMTCPALTFGTKFCGIPHSAKCSPTIIHTSSVTYIIGSPVSNEVGGNRAEKLSKDCSVPLCRSINQTESRVGDGICNKVVLLATGLVLVGVRSGPHERGNLGVSRAAFLGRNQAKVLYEYQVSTSNLPMNASNER
jgi:hypothetical protein